MKNLVNFFYELGMLKRLDHVGLKLTGASEVDSIADHTFRSCVIAYILAKKEGANPEKSVMILLVHDFPETRTGDFHKVAARYLDSNRIKKRAFLDQMKTLPADIAQDFKKYYDEEAQRNSKEGIIAQDADWLEMAITAKEFIEQGFSRAQNWIDNVEEALETQTAKEMLEVVKKTHPNDWWRDLKKMTYKKLKK